MGLTINASFDASVTSSSNAAAIESAIAAASQFFQNKIQTNITVNIDFGFGELAHGAYTVDSNSLAEALPAGGVTTGYAELRAALASHAVSADDRTGLASLMSDPTGGGSFEVPGAQAKALGLEAPNAAGIDGYVGLSDVAGFTYNAANRSAPGLYDAIGALEHEIAHALGRVAGLQGDAANTYTALDLFRYSAPGAHELTYGNPGYFSINGGATNLDPFDKTADPGDWASSVPGNSFGYGFPGQAGLVTRTDLREMDVLGYTLNLPTDTAARLLTDYSLLPRFAFASISDTAADVSAHLNGLAALTAPAVNAIYATTLTDGTTGFVTTTAQQAVADRAVLATIGNSYHLSIAMNGGPLTFNDTAHVSVLRLTGAGPATVTGNSGTEKFIVANVGTDIIHGGGGVDTVAYGAMATPGIIATIAGGVGTVRTNGHGMDYLTGIQNIFGSNGNDQIHIDGVGVVKANGGNDTITSIGTNPGTTDYLYAGSGNDTITTGGVGTHHEFGGTGQALFAIGGGTSIITAGAGAAIIQLASTSTSGASVVVNGFKPGTDVIDLSHAGVTAALVDSLVTVTQGATGAVIATNVGGHAELITLAGIGASSIDLHSADFLLG